MVIQITMFPFSPVGRISDTYPGNRLTWRQLHRAGWPANFANIQRKTHNSLKSTPGAVPMLS